MSIFSKYSFPVALALFLFASQQSRGQAARSPFTTFGIGDQYGYSPATNQGMGGLGIGTPQFWYLNNQNPALLPYNLYTTFTAGIIGESRLVRGEAINERNTGGNLNYLALAFPVKPGRWTTSVGLMPFTNVDYRLQYEEELIGNPSLTTTISEVGTGGFSQVYWSNGVRILKGFSVGLKASYFFGSIINEYNNSVNGTSQPIPFLIKVTEQTYLKDFNFTGGVSYSKDSLGGNNNYRFCIGAVYSLAADLNAERTDKFVRSTFTGDTLEASTLSSINGALSIPEEFGVGISIARRYKWTIGADFRYQDWSKFKSINPEDEKNLVPSWNVVLGGEFTPDMFSTESVLKRVTYRIGLNYEKSPFLGNNQEVRDFGINFGFSIPTGRSSLDLAFKVGKRGNRSENILEENYFKVYFGLTLNDQWFIKRRFD